MEVTNRTFQGRYLLLPRGEVRLIVLGALGRAQLFAEAFRDAAEILLRGHPDPGFPEGSFPPGRPFVPHQAPG